MILPLAPQEEAAPATADVIEAASAAAEDKAEAIPVGMADPDVTGTLAVADGTPLDASQEVEEDMAIPF